MKHAFMVLVLALSGCKGCDAAARCRGYGMEPMTFHRTGTFCIERRPDGFGQVLVLPEVHE